MLRATVGTPSFIIQLPRLVKKLLNPLLASGKFFSKNEPTSAAALPISPDSRLVNAAYTSVSPLPVLPDGKNHPATALRTSPPHSSICGTAVSVTHYLKLAHKPSSAV